MNDITHLTEVIISNVQPKAEVSWQAIYASILDAIKGYLATPTQRYEVAEGITEVERPLASNKFSPTCVLPQAGTYNIYAGTIAPDGTVRYVTGTGAVTTEATPCGRVTFGPFGPYTIRVRKLEGLDLSVLRERGFQLFVCFSSSDWAGMLVFTLTT